MSEETAPAEAIPDWAIEKITDDERALLLANNGAVAGFSGAFVRVQAVTPQPDMQTYCNMVAKLPYLVGNEFVVLCVRNRDPLHVLTVHKDARAITEVMLGRLL